MTTKSRSIPLHFRISESEMKRVDALCDRYPVPKASVARRALAIGLATLEADPASFARDDEEISGASS